MAAIFNEGIAERIATFETEGRTAEAVAPWIGARLPLLVADAGGDVLGWAKLSGYSDRDCYAGIAEISVYVARAGRRRGVARALVTAMCSEAERRGMWKLIALLFPENAPSRALFEQCGFEEVGTFRHHGRLEGEWRDVVMIERLLGAAAA